MDQRRGDLSLARKVSGGRKLVECRYINTPPIHWLSGSALTPPRKSPLSELMVLRSIATKLPADSGGPGPIEPAEPRPVELTVPLARASS